MSVVQFPEEHLVRSPRGGCGFVLGDGSEEVKQKDGTWKRIYFTRYCDAVCDTGKFLCSRHKFLLANPPTKKAPKKRRPDDDAFVGGLIAAKPESGYER